MSEVDLGLSEVVDGSLIKWDQPGKTFVGILQSYKTQNTANGVGHVYKVKTKEGTLAFFAPTDLQDKLAGVKIGEIVQITHADTTKANNGNTWKVFKVLHGEATPEKLKMMGMEVLEEVQTEAAFGAAAQAPVAQAEAPAPVAAAAEPAQAPVTAAPATATPPVQAPAPADSPFS